MKFTITILTLFLSACSSTSFYDNADTKNLPALENRKNTNNNTESVSNDSKVKVDKIADSTSDITQTQLVNVDPNLMFKDYSVYFDLDEYVVQEKFYSLLKQHADYLSKNPNQFVYIEGHTDERGGTEYNLALGQRRSNAVRVFMHLHGVKETQMEAYSYGSTKPRAQGSNEEAWSVNRRVDLFYKN